MHDLKAVLADLHQHKCVALDTETTGLDFKINYIIGMSLCFEDSTSYYLPFKHKNTEEKQLDWNEVLPLLKEEVDRPDLTIIFHNSKFDLHMFREAGLSINKDIEDTILIAHMLDETQEKGLKELANKYIGANSDHWKKAVRIYREKYKKVLKQELGHSVSLDDVTYDYVPIDLMTQYAAADTLFTFQLYHIFKEQIEAQQKLNRIYNALEKTLTRALLGMESHGVAIDIEFLRRAKKEVQEKVDVVQTQILKLLNKNINIGSNEQVGKLLDELKIKTGKRTEGGAISVDEDSLESVKDKHPVIPLILEYRKYEKLNSTYLSGILDRVVDAQGNPIGDGRLHCNFNQIGAKTGRLSCSQPNLQNIPRNDEKAPVNIRQAFIPLGPDYVMIFIDMSQIELRMTAHYSEDPVLLDAYFTGKDIHAATAAKLNQKDISAVVEDERFKAKIINFGIIYGIGAKSLGKQIGKTKAECEAFIAKYFEEFPGIQTFIDKAYKTVKKQGYVNNFYGRIRRLPDAQLLWSPETKHRIAKACRQGANYLVQGTCADMFKLSICRVHQLLEGKKSKVVLNIHDELVFYIHRDELDLIPKIKATMEQFRKFKVPIVAEVSYSFENWAAKKKLKPGDDLASMFPPRQGENHANV